MKKLMILMIGLLSVSSAAIAQDRQRESKKISVEERALKKAQELELNEEQTASFTAIQLERAEKMKVLREENLQNRKLLHDETSLKLKEVLGEEKYTTYQESKKRNRYNRKASNKGDFKKAKSKKGREQYHRKYKHHKN